MKKFSQINEAKTTKRSIFVDKRVVDMQYGVSEDFKNLLMDYVRERGGPRSNNSYISYYVCGEVKPMDEVKNKDNIVIDPEDPNAEYVYERGDDPISDYLMDNGCKMGEEIIILIWW